MNPTRLWLVGMMGSGKTEVGRIAASKLGWRFVDLDHRIESASGRTIAAIFRESGETAFRELERRVLEEASREKEATVVACGGGAVLDARNRAAMRATGRVIWLQASAKALAARVGKSVDRPLLEGADPAVKLAEIAGRREKDYGDAAHAVIDTEGKLAREVAEEVAREALGYRIEVGAGLLDAVGEITRRDAAGGQRAILVTDVNVGRLHARRVERSLKKAGYRSTRIAIPVGERHKTLATVKKIWEAMLTAGIDRKTPVVALGGGVVGDLAGFAAATVLRGVPLVQVPTTLVAQVDSAVGGKTGFDTPRGKNLIGAFKAPSAVVADVEVLATLPVRELVAGMGEVVKYGVIADEELFTRLERLGDPARLTSDAVEAAALVRRCVERKADVVAGDPEENGIRAVLNFGHTAGHAIETAAGYRGWLHGEAVAAGMVAEGELAVARGECEPAEVERLVSLLGALGLPVERPRGIGRHVAADKKRVGASLRMPMLRRIGEVEIRPVDVREVMRFLG